MYIFGKYVLIYAINYYYQSDFSQYSWHVIVCLHYVYIYIFIIDNVIGNTSDNNSTVLQTNGSSKSVKGICSFMHLTLPYDCVCTSMYRHYSSFCIMFMYRHYSSFCIMFMCNT